MANIYEDGADESNFVDDEKPHWDDDIDITDIVPPEEPGPSIKKSKKKKKKKDSGTIEDGVDEGEMDANVTQMQDDEEEWDGTEEMRKRKLDEYMDEIYGLDFNDMVSFTASCLSSSFCLSRLMHFIQVGDMPTRFKYAKVESQTFALTPTEILMATDAELNQYMGIKKYAPYRKEGKGKTWDRDRATRLAELKDKLKERGLGAEAPTEEGKEVVKKRKGKKERQREKATLAATAASVDNEEGKTEDAVEDPTYKQQKRKAQENGAGEEEGTEDVPAKKRRRRHHKKSDQSTATS